MAGELRCKHCNYVWITKSEKRWASCPNCLRKVRTTPKPIFKEEIVKED